MFAKTNLYDLLGLPRDATPEEIRHAYHEAARIHHPDVSKEPGSSEGFLRIQEAYEVLSDPEKRTAYDARLAVESKEPVLTEVQYSRSTVPTLEENQIVYALVKLSAPTQELAQPNPPLNVCLVLDRSTSMQGARMDVVKAAAIELLRQLKPDDVFSIVVFSDRAEVMVPASRNLDRKMIESQIRMIRPGGGTEIFQGLETGMAEVNRHSSRSLVNHIILITDGWTYGDEEDCLQLAEQAASQGIGITGMGLGVEWNDYFMDELTKRTGGNSTYIARDDDFRGFLQEKINNLNQIFGDRVILNLETGPDVKLNSIYRLQPETAELSSNSPIRVGNILKSTPLSILMEFVVPPIPTDVKRFMLASGDLNMVLPSEPARPKKMAVKLSRLTDQEKKVEEPPRPIYQAVSQVTLYRMQERARQNVAQGKIQEASMCLQRLATQLMAIGERELANTALTEAERIQKTHMFSLEGAKEIKYGTRALLPSGLESRML